MTPLTVFFISFGLIFTAELGDKTQLMILALTLRYGGKPVLVGSVLGFALLSGSAAAIGKGLGELFPAELMTRISAWVFILFGSYMLMKKKEEPGPEQTRPSTHAGIIAAFSLIAVSEMGDKTQIATVLLSVKYQSFLSVFLGSLAALSVASLTGILVAGKIHKYVPVKYITQASGALFILLGAGTLLFS